MRAWVVAGAILTIAAGAKAASPDVQYAPPSAWVIPSPTPTDTPDPAGAAARVIYTDTQIQLGKGVAETYAAFRLKILRPEGLNAGNISGTWSPNTDDLIVHALKIIRGDQVIDVLATTKFQVIQRENSLEYSVLKGDLTATLQAPGLQVGDELEVALTVRRRDPTFEGRSYGVQQLPVNGQPGAYRLRLAWPETEAVRWSATPDLEKSPVVHQPGQDVLTYELRDPRSALVAEGAPGRVNVRRIVEYSEFSSWAQLSGLMQPLFDRAETLAADSPVHAEAARISTATIDPVARTEAALRLVQDRIRYVYVGLNGGNYRPASADDTWSRRFGDCKAKTALLIALLRELGVQSEAVMVNSNGGDGTDRYLPTPLVFDHVVVRATVEGKSYWLDATRLDATSLDRLPPPVFRWALPVRASGAQLEAVAATPAVVPQLSDVLDIDASAGFNVPARISVERVLSGDQALQFRSALSSLSKDDATRQLEALWRQTDSWIEPKAVGWRFDEVRNSMILTLSGEGKPEWRGDEPSGRTLSIPGAGFTPPNPLHRAKDEDQAAPWATDFPNFKRWTTIIRLPPDSRRLHWDYDAGPVHERLGGVSYWREIEFGGRLVRTTMSRRTYLPEITAAQATALNDGLASFDNAVSTVSQHLSYPALHTGQETFETAVAHASAGAACDRSLANKDDEKRIVGAAEACILQASALAKAGRAEDALAELDQAVALEPESPTPFSARAAVLERLGRSREALSDLDEAWRIDPLDPATRNARYRELKIVGAQPREAQAGLPFDPWIETAPR